VHVGRLLLCDATAKVMERSFGLLGIRTLEKM
jgi:arginyl-tRNA synthetase